MKRLDLSACKWTFCDADGGQKRPASVPGCVHEDLRKNGAIPDPFWGCNELDLQWVGERAWQYETAFSLDAAMLGEQHVDLVCDGLDTLARVYLNGHEIVRADNMFAAHRADIAAHLKPGKNALKIVFDSATDYVRSARPEHTPRDINDPVGRCTVIRKQQCQFGWDWGPRFVTAGIWRGIRIEAWSHNRIEHVGITQKHQSPDVKVRLHADTALTMKGQRLRARLSLEGETVAEATEDAGQSALALTVRRAKLWWPAGQGDQPLYTLDVELLDADGAVLDHKTRRIGLRTVRLERAHDQWGESFRFVVNHRKVFAKGANWIPAHAFVAGLRREDYARDLASAAQAHMNMIRVWGGGVYESEDFYDLCDELGLLVWQDFMFACTLYPHDAAFLDSVRTEATQQVRRLHHRACLALWCGNNELPQINKADLRDEATRRGYEKLFHELLPEVVRAEGGATDYWPSSEWRGFFDSTHEDGEKRGDTHYWEVWHRRQPVSDYERWQFRFCSEFGMQSYSSLPTQDTFCPADEANIYGPVMENHQKNRAGNQIISDYLSRRYRFPKDQRALIYLSQLNQAHCMRFAVEHFRRIAPRCMGALYWQLNDCWPAASWSSIEFTGRWKALHYAARRFFAPALVSAHILRDEETGIGNYRKTGDGRVDLYSVYDSPAPGHARLLWELRRLDVPGEKAGDDLVLSGSKSVRLHYGESVRQKSLNFAKEIRKHGADALYLRVALESDEGVLSEQTVFFSPPRFLKLDKQPARTTVRALGKGRYALTVSAPAFQHGVWLDIEGLNAQFSDNVFDLYPRLPKAVILTLPAPMAVGELRKRLTAYSLADTY